MRLCDEKNTGVYDVYINGYDARGNIQGIQRNGLVSMTGGNPLYGIVDQLSFSYIENQLTAATDAGFPTRGFQGGQNEQFTYDGTGNLVAQTNNSLSNVVYNFLDLPETMTFPSGTITNHYTADGRKVKSVTVDNGVVTERVYEDGFEYSADALEAFYHDEGRVVFNDSLEIDGGVLTRYAEWSIEDHLGNTRVRFVDKDKDGEITPDTTSTAANELTASYHYYPFGMRMEGDWDADQGTAFDYQYNGKELEEDLGLGWYDYGARWYDPSVCRFISSDPLADQFAWVTSYNYAENEPIANVDWWGLQQVRFGEGVELTPDKVEEGKQFGRNLVKGLKTGVVSAVKWIAGPFMDGGKEPEDVSGGVNLQGENGHGIGTLDINRDAETVNVDEMLIPSNRAAGGAKNLSKARQALVEGSVASESSELNDSPVATAGVSAALPQSSSSLDVALKDTVPRVDGVDTIIARDGSLYRRVHETTNAPGELPSSRTTYTPIKKKQ